MRNRGGHGRTPDTKTRSTMQDFDVTTLIFLVLAVFVIWRLRSVLGQKTGHERPPVNPFPRRDDPQANLRTGAAGGTDNVIRMPTGDRPAVQAEPAADRWQGYAEAGSPQAAGLDEIARAEPGFDPRAFVNGAKVAYETIVSAFAAGDVKTLRGLLSRDVLAGFERAIEERNRRGDKVETTFVSVDRADLAGVDVRNRLAQVTVRFASKLINATRDATGRVIEGSPDTVVDVVDTWTFARTLGSRDPNWQLVATESGQ